MQLAAFQLWLRDLQRVALQVLLQLTEHDLRDMGVHDPTQRLRLLRGIDVLRTRGPFRLAARALVIAMRMSEGGDANAARGEANAARR